jgi:hypothetical protein
MKKHSAYFFITLLFPFYCHAQDPSHEKAQSNTTVSKVNRKGVININAGVGASLFTWVAGGLNLGEGGPKVYGHIPALNLSVDYNITSLFSLGLAGTYESMSDNPYINEGQWDYMETERVTRYNLATRILFHLARSAKIDSYTGIRTGISIWSDDILSISPYHYSNNVPIFSTLAYPSEVKPSIQVLYGFIIYVLPNFGIHFETGIGTPYFIEGGLTLKFNTRHA